MNNQTKVRRIIVISISMTIIFLSFTDQVQLHNFAVLKSQNYGVKF